MKRKTIKRQVRIPADWLKLAIDDIMVAHGCKRIDDYLGPVARYGVYRTMTKKLASELMCFTHGQMVEELYHHISIDAPTPDTIDYLEPEIGDLALNLIRETERETNARRTNTTGEEIILQSKNNLGISGCQGSGNTCSCASK